MLGFTLIEAVVALAICSAMVVGLLGIRSTMMTQAREAGQVARANVLAGQLVGQWRLGEIDLPPGDRRSGVDAASGMRWELECQQQEVDPGVFLKCLVVRIYDQQRDAKELVAFDVWQSLEQKVRP